MTRRKTLDTIIETTNLTKRYGPVPAVDGLSLRIRKGEIYGFLGMNGAGKTTTIRMLLGLIRPTSGEYRLFGEKMSPRNRHLLKRVGAMTEFPGFYENLTARENLEINIILMGAQKRNAIAEAMETAGLKDDPRKRTGEYSLGMKQRLGIARALLHHPELLILDEPANGLDPAGIRDLRALLTRLARERNVAVLMSSHILSEIEQTADRIGILHRGKLLEELSLEDLRKKNRTFMEFRVSDENKGAMLIESRLGITDYEIPETGVMRIYTHIGEQAAINALLVSGGVGVNAIGEKRAVLEEYFLTLTGEINK